jgi:hypothetical protein
MRKKISIKSKSNTKRNNIKNTKRNNKKNTKRNNKKNTKRNRRNNKNTKREKRGGAARGDASVMARLLADERLNPADDIQLSELFRKGIEFYGQFKERKNHSEVVHFTSTASDNIKGDDIFKWSGLRKYKLFMDETGKFKLNISGKNFNDKETVWEKTYDLAKKWKYKYRKENKASQSTREKILNIIQKLKEVSLQEPATQLEKMISESWVKGEQITPNDSKKLANLIQSHEKVIEAESRKRDFDKTIYDSVDFHAMIRDLFRNEILDTFDFSPLFFDQQDLKDNGFPKDLKWSFTPKDRDPINYYYPVGTYENLTQAFCNLQYLKDYEGILGCGEPDFLGRDVIKKLTATKATTEKAYKEMDKELHRFGHRFGQLGPPQGCGDCRETPTEHIQRQNKKRLLKKDITMQKTLGENPLIGGFLLFALINNEEPSSVAIDYSDKDLKKKYIYNLNDSDASDNDFYKKELHYGVRLLFNENQLPDWVNDLTKGQLVTAGSEPPGDTAVPLTFYQKIKIAGEKLFNFVKQKSEYYDDNIYNGIWTRPSEIETENQKYWKETQGRLAQLEKDKPQGPEIKWRFSYDKLPY